MTDTKPKKMTEEELVNALAQQEHNSRSRSSSKLSRQRAKALAYYQGDQYGNERPGRSKFVTREVMDTVEWIMPYLMRTFFGTVDAVEFTPRGPDDVQGAQQETAYINYLFQQRNDGFKSAYQWIKDGLLQKNGIIKVWWDVAEERTTENYTGLDEMDVELLAVEDDITIVDQKPEPLQTLLDPTTGELVQMPQTFAVTVTVAEKKGRLRVEPVPPEEFVIDREAKDIKSAMFCQQTTQLTMSRLRQMGFPESKLANLSSGDSAEQSTSDERLVRFRKDDTDPYSTGAGGAEAPTDPSQRLLWVKESYVRVDFDGDGVAELRKVIRVGATVLENEPVSEIPFAGWTPIIMSHKFYGMSVADTVTDLQLLQSTLVRNMLDNQYQANNGRYGVLEGQVNLDDLTTSHPQGYVRMKSPNAIQELRTPQLGQEAFQFLEFVDQLRERRTGVSALTQGVAPEMLNSHTTASQHTTAMSAAQQKLELIARVLAETGFKDLFRLMHGIVLRHQDKADVAKVHGQYVRVNPSEWRERKDMTVNVGIGNLSPEEKLRQMNIIQIALQASASAGANIVSPENARQFTEDLVRLVNPAAVGRYTSPPPPPEPPPPDPNMIRAETEQQFKAAKAQIDARKQQLDEMEAQAEQQLKERKFALEQEKQAFEEEKFEFEKRLRRVEAMIEATQDRPVALEG